MNTTSDGKETNGFKESLDKMKEDSELLKNFMNEQMPDDNNNYLHIDDADGQQECVNGYPAEVMPPLTVQPFPYEI